MQFKHVLLKDQLLLGGQMVALHKICPHPNSGTWECYTNLTMDLETKRSSWIIQVGYKPNNKRPSKRHSKKKTDQTEEGNLITEQRWEQCCPGNANPHQKLEEAKNRFPLRVLLTPSFPLGDTDFRLLASKTVRE